MAVGVGTLVSRRSPAQTCTERVEVAQCSFLAPGFSETRAFGILFVWLALSQNRLSLFKKLQASLGALTMR